MITESVQIGTQVNSIKQAFLDNLVYIQSRFKTIATTNDHYMALAYTVRDHLMDYWSKTVETYFAKALRTGCYLSAESLIGPQLVNNLSSFIIYPQVMQAMDELELDLDIILDQESEPGLGNVGFGQLADPTHKKFLATCFS